MTTLRYTPDKPYKLRINAVNSEVEIYGITDDLFYIRHGKNYGFLPKNHLREQARGNYPFSVTIDVGKYRIDQQTREQNFLHNFLESSQPAQPTEVKVNETIIEPIGGDEKKIAPTEENNQEPSAGKKQENAQVDSTPGEKRPDAPKDVPIETPTKDVPLDASNDIPIDTLQAIENDLSADQQPEVLDSNEIDNDSGIDDDDEEDDEEEEESEEEQQEQPELVAIPPSKVVEEMTAPEITKSEPLAVPIPASAKEETPPQQNVYDQFENSTDEEPLKMDEIVPDFIPIKTEAVEEANNHLQGQNDTLIASESNEKTEAPEIARVENKNEEVLTVPTLDVQPEMFNNTENIQEVKELPAVLEEPVNKLPEAVNKLPEPAPVKEEIEEFPTVETTTLPAIPDEVVMPPVVESTSEIPNFESATPPPQIIIPIASEVPKTEEEPFVEQTDSQLPVQKPMLKLEPDALLKKFNEKLGNRIVEGTGKGSVEPLFKHDHSHSHDHGNEHHSHDHGHHEHHSHDHDHHVDDKIPEIHDESIATPVETEEEEAEPGFFGGLFKKFFSDEDDSEQHFHKQAEVESIMKPDQTGEFSTNLFLFGSYNTMKHFQLKIMYLTSSTFVGCQAYFISPRNFRSNNKKKIFCLF